MVESVPADIDNGGEGDADGEVGWWYTGDKPVDDFRVRETEDELVDYAVNTYGPAYEFERCVRWVAEYKMIAVESR